MKKLYPFLFFILAGVSLYGQYYQTGQDPASIRWKQINTPSFQLIFPDYYEEQAKKLAGNLEAVYPYAGFTLKHNPAKIPVVLHTQTVQSNGLVAWAPKRAEFFTTPHQSIYPQEWLEQLALHEVRHVVQVDKIQNNLPRWVRYLLGEQGTALAFGIYLKWWFIEGDAVITETALSDFGRGRLPSFLMEHKAQVVEKGVFSYDKAFLGSYRDFVPNHYKLGYLLAGNLRARHGADLWEETVSRAGSKPLSINPLQQVLKQRTGMNIEENYISVFDSLHDVWISQDLKFESVPLEFTSTDPRYYTNYRYNHWLNDSVLLSYKTGYVEVPSFVKIDIRNNKESRIASPGTVFGESVGFRDEWIVWSEQISDLRWQHSGRSLIRALNSSNGRFIEIKPEFKALSPSISPDKDRVAVVETDFKNNHFISVYHLHDGSLQDRFQMPGNNYLFSPEWLDEHIIAALSLDRSGKQIIRIDLDRGEYNIIGEPDLGEVKHLRKAGEYIYFIATRNGKNSLYRTELSGNVTELVYEPRFGVESPAVSSDGKRVVLSDYTADGFRLIVVSTSNESVKNVNLVEPHTYALADILAGQETGYPLFSDSAYKDYQVEPYKKTANLFNFHSWAPVFIDVGAYEFSPGVSLMSQNVLGTSETILGYRWDITEKTGKLVADYSFKGLYPVFDLELSYGQSASHYNLISQRPGNMGNIIQDTLLQRFTWNEASGNLTVSIPLTFDKGPYNRLLQPEIGYGFSNIRHDKSTPDRFHKGSFHSLSYRLYFQQVRRRSYLDVYPNFGFIGDVVYRHSPEGSIKAGRLKAVQSILYLPGFMKNHGIKIYAGAQEKDDSGTIGFGDVVRYPRGWNRLNTTTIATGGVDYKLPLAYPDFRMWGLLYTRRISASLFADYSRLNGNFYNNGTITGHWSKDISSFGTELTADVNVLRFYAPATIGFRASYLPEYNNLYFNLLLSVSFDAF